MEGILQKNDDNQWVIHYKVGRKYTDVDVHPDDTDYVEKIHQDYLNETENRFNNFPYIEFELVYNQKMSGVSRYGKINRKNAL